MNLLRMLGLAPPPPARFPAGRVGYAVGDIHGRDDLLLSLCAMLEARVEADTREGGPPLVIFLGDYVDRGPRSAAVLDVLLAGRPAGFERRFLKGNHEASMLGFMEAPLNNRAWVMQGGAETLLAYGVAPPSPLGASPQDWIAAAEALKAAVPERHAAFLNSLERYIVMGDYAFVHAGVNPWRPLDKQTDAELFWSRQKFLNHRLPFSHCVVHGHTPSDRPYADARRIGIDTGAYATGILTAARFEDGDVSFLSTGLSTS